MATPREIRELALRVLYEIDAAGGPGADPGAAPDPKELTEQPDRFSAGELAKARALADEAYTIRTEADARLEALAPTWPATRQPAVDRAIIRLAFAELRRGQPGPSIVINECVELAKRYSTDKSPGFINAVLDKMARALKDTSPSGSGPSGSDGFGEPGQPGQPEPEDDPDSPGESVEGVGGAWPS